jgi:DHA1 family tetracycline resistance protein-like MFS transporter
MKRSRLFTIFLIVFIDLLGFGLILPLLPFYADTYGASATVVGFLTASYAAAQLIGAPVLGRLSDRYGRRPVLLISILGTSLGFLLLGIADPLGAAITQSLPTSSQTAANQNLIILSLLFASRILDGLTGGNISVAQAYITDSTDETNRAQGLGIIGAAFGLGFIFGPAAGGALSVYGYAVPAYTAAVLAFFNLIAVFIFLEESLPEEARGQASTQQNQFSIRALWDALNRPRVGPLFHIRFTYGLGFAIFQTIFPLYAQYRLSLDARATGYVLAYVGFLVVLVQGVVIGRIANKFSDSRLIMAGLILMMFSLLAWGFTPNLLVLLIALAPLALAGGILNTVINTALTKSVYPEEAGGTLGLSASLESLSRVLAPSMGGALLGQIGTWAPGVVSASLLAWTVWFAWRRLINSPDDPLPPREFYPPGPEPQPRQT